jgi:acetyl-CoA acetyltransferase
MTAARSRACIVGIGETEYRRWGGIEDRSEFQLACQAIGAAAADAGIAVSAIDGFATYAELRIDAATLQLALGIPRLRFSSSVWGGRGGGSCGALAHAAMAVETGRAGHVVVFRSLAQGQSRRYGRFDPARPQGNLSAPFGLFSAPQMLALVLQRYAHRYGLDPADMAEVALTCRDNAQRNPRAVMHGKPLTLQQCLEARPIADPLRLYDCCMESDGACAVIVTTRERARDLARKPVEILAATEFGEAHWGVGPMGSHNMPEDRYTTGGQHDLAQDLFALAGLAPRDVDVAQLYDHFTGMVLIELEDFGFCAPGEGGAFVRHGNLRWPDGGLPINTAGGSLSEAYVHGLNHVAEGVRQLRGTSTSQVAGAQVCLVTGGAGISPSSAALLGA